MLLCQSDELRMSYRWDIDKPVHPAWMIISVKDCWDQDSSIPCANALEILQSCSKQLICSYVKVMSYRWDTANTVHPAWMIMSVKDCSYVKVISYRWDTDNLVQPAWRIMSVKDCLTHWGRDKMDASSQTTFSNAPTRRQAIIWTEDGKFTDAYMRHSASMS